ncbi:non-hydrolyzing UDP-N-acetylglucosamine 2-epimerase [Chloroflexota bacterium]
MKIISVVATRPNFMKIASIFRASESLKFNTQHMLVHTGQHYDYEMSQIFFDELGLPKPDIYLGVGSGTHAEQTGKVMIEFEKVLYQEKPDLVIVVGDVNSTLAASLAAAKLHIELAHIEAGIRTNDRSMPEEINRVLTDHLSDYLFTTSKYDDEYLLKEGIEQSKIFRVGNVMVDSLLHYKDKADKSDILSRLGLSQQKFALLTLHRPGNVDDKNSLMQIMTSLTQLSKSIPIVFPAHPRTQKNLQDFELLNKLSIPNKRFMIIKPLGYLDFLKLEMESKFIMTDSGGIEPESTALGIPCLTLLDHSGWIETVEVGTNTLVGNDPERIAQEAGKIIDGNIGKSKIPALWDGKAAHRIVDVLIRK